MIELPTSGKEMDPERWKRIERIYHAALCEPAERRAAELAAACSNDPGLLENFLADWEEADSALAALAEAKAAMAKLRPHG
jgi:hypothetical protein